MTMRQKNDLETIVSICERAENLGLDRNGRFSHLMDIEHTCELFSIDLKAWLEADDLNFAHDWVGIYNNFNRQTKQMDNCFVPRFAR